MNNLADIFKALGDEVRLEMIRMLAGKELCVCDILEAFDKSQSTISHHLKILKYAGVVEDVRDGKWIYYRIKPEAFGPIQSFVGEITPKLTESVRSKKCN